MIKRHENYKELVLRLAKTDFKLRYYGSFLGYLWAVLKPLLMFIVLNFVFSSIFNFRNSGTPNYPLELLTGIIMFQFFSEGTMNGMMSLLNKSQLVTKIYVPRWTIVIGSTLNSFFVYLVNLIVLGIFFVIYDITPTLEGVLMFVLYSILLYILVVAFSFLTSTLFVRFRDLGTIWEVLLSVLMYASPIIYPLSMLPDKYHSFVLMNPLAFIIHYSKQGVINQIFTSFEKFAILTVSVLLLTIFAYIIFKKYERRVAEFV